MSSGFGIEEHPVEIETFHCTDSSKSNQKTSMTTRFTAILQVYLRQPLPPVKHWKILLVHSFTAACPLQPAHSNKGEDAGVFLTNVIYQSLYILHMMSFIHSKLQCVILLFTVHHVRLSTLSIPSGIERPKKEEDSR